MYNDNEINVFLLMTKFTTLQLQECQFINYQLKSSIVYFFFK